MVQIKIKQNTWKELNKRKQSPSETFDDVILRAVMELPEEKGEEK